MHDAHANQVFKFTAVEKPPFFMKYPHHSYLFSSISCQCQREFYIIETQINFRDKQMERLKKCHNLQLLAEKLEFTVGYNTLSYHAAKSGKYQHAFNKNT